MGTFQAICLSIQPLLRSKVGGSRSRSGVTGAGETRSREASLVDFLMDSDDIFMGFPGDFVVISWWFDGIVMEGPP